MEISISQNPKCFWPRSRIGAFSSLEISMKRFLGRFGLNQNKSEQMKINDNFFRFISKAYSTSTAILNKKMCLYQLKVPKQLTWKYHILLKIDNFWVSCLGALSGARIFVHFTINHVTICREKLALKNNSLQQN